MKKFDSFVIIFNLIIFSSIFYWNILSIIFWIIIYNPFLIIVHLISLLIFGINMYLFLTIKEKKFVNNEREL